MVGAFVWLGLEMVVRIGAVSRGVEGPLVLV